jgi:hypothetical protein
MGYRVNRSDLRQAFFLSIALMIWGAVGMGGWFGNGVWRWLSGALFLLGFVTAIVALRRVRR